MLQYTLESICKTFKSLLNLGKNNQPKEGPNSLEELLKQFDTIPKQKTDKDIVRDFQIFITMAQLEVEMLRLDPSIAFKGQQFWTDDKGHKFYDWVPCVVRPEVLYCCNNKN